MKCHGCGDTGHVERECPNSALDASGKPPWCGICDETTRQVEVGDKVGRCKVCHPLRHQMLRQDKKCPRCHVIIYEWDHAACDSHSGPGIIRKLPEKETVTASTGKETA